MLFAASAQHDIEEKSVYKLGEMLGVYWTREAVDAMFSTQKGGEHRAPRKDLLIPLLLGMQPKLQDFIKDSFGSSRGISAPDWYDNTDHSEVVEGYSMNRRDFINLASLFTGLIPKDFQAEPKKVNFGHRK
jgi:hypothetical protein